MQVVLDALNMALWQRRPSGVIHHSDHGSQGGFKRSSQHGTAFVGLCKPPVKCLGGGSPVERLSRSGVERRGHGRELVRAVDAQVGAFREVLPQQPVGVLVRAACLHGLCGSQK